MLSLVPLFNGIAFSGAALKQQFNELKNRKSKKIEMKNRTYYFYNDIINIKEFKSTKIAKNRTKILIFTILDTSQLKKMVIV